MKGSQRARLSSMERKCDTTRWCDDVGRRRDNTGEGKGGDDASWTDANLTGLKINKIHAFDSVDRNER
jgi:hypothetical protein